MFNMYMVNMYDAKARFSELLRRVQAGEEITIAKAGKPVARLVPIQEKTGERVPGSARGKIRLGADFDEPLFEHVLREFAG